MSAWRSFRCVVTVTPVFGIGEVFVDAAKPECSFLCIRVVQEFKVLSDYGHGHCRDFAPTTIRKVGQQSPYLLGRRKGFRPFSTSCPSVCISTCIAFNVALSCIKLFINETETDRRSYAGAREAARMMAITAREGATAPTKSYKAYMNFHKVVAKEDPMDGEISEALKILRRSLPRLLARVIVSEDGYKKIVKEREKSNRKVWYDGEPRNCTPTYLHEHTSLMVIDSMVDEAVRVMRNAGSYSSLRQATLWWIEQKKATVAVLLCLTVSGAAHRVFRTTEDCDAEIDRYSIEFNRQRREEHRPLKPRWNIMGTNGLELFSEPVCLVKDGVDVTDAIPHDLTVEVGDLVPHNWLSDDVVRRLALNFLQPETFLEGLSDPIVGTALNRVVNTFEVEEH
ncbi:hypothetical protein V1527DRAFT_484194 [Lipomyces starkeyi]